MSYARTVALVLVLALIVGAIYLVDSKTAHRGAATAPAQAIAVTEASSTPATGFLTPAEKAKKYEPAVELVDPTGFINTNNLPVALKDYIGKKVILLDVWTYSCINCQRTLLYIEGWYEKYKDAGLVVIGIHTPEFGFEKVYDNVKQAVQKFGLTYPVVLDSNYGTWNAYHNQYWPMKYLIDIDGYVVYSHPGEGAYPETEAEIQTLLAERKAKLGTSDIIPGGTLDPANAIKQIDTRSPETYFGSSRNEFLGNGAQNKAGAQTLTAPSGELKVNTLYLGGTWSFAPEFAELTSATGVIEYQYAAKNVYFVASSDATTTVIITEDGRPAGSVEVKGAGLYKLVEHPSIDVHVLKLEVKKGIKAFTFTFG